MGDNTRLEDYLNDKLQTFADFESLDSLIAAVQSQQALLQQQLEDAHRDSAEARETSTRHDTTIRQLSQDFEAQQADIDRRLMIVTQSDVPDEAARRFDKSMDTLNRLDTASLYLELLLEVETVNKTAMTQLSSSPQSAFQSYRTLYQLSQSLKNLQADAEGAAPHLIDHVEKSRLALRENLRTAFAADFDKVLSKILWPKPQTAMPASLETDWAIAVERLLELQRPELEFRMQENSTRSAYREPFALLPLEVMVQPLELRFKYHFSGDKTTNRLDKPEYFLSHVLDLLKSHEVFVDDYLQPVLLDRFGDTIIASDLAYMDATSALITALLPMVRRKVYHLISQISSQPQLLSHLMHELMGFDTTLQTEWRYVGSTSVEGAVWKGLAWEVLVQKDWFGRWLQVEKDFALARYQGIIDTADSSTLDFDSVDSTATKPTKAAIRVNDLLETITDRYRPLSSFSQKLSFLIGIQISIFDRFHARLHSSLEAYLSMTSSIGRVTQGITAAEVATIQGVSGLDRLCRVFGSADYIERKMRDWSDDVFFLDLWTDLQTRASGESPAQPSSPDGSKKRKYLAGTMTVDEVASRTSNTLARTDSADDQEGPQGALFDETASAYARLRVRSEGIITETIVGRLRDSLRPYSRNNPWSSLNPPESVDSEPSADLQDALDVLEESFRFLARALGPIPLRRVAKAVARMLDSYIVDRVISAHFFSQYGAAQIMSDVHAMAKIFSVHVSEAVSASGLRKGLEAAQLLNLKVRSSGAAAPNAGDATADGLENGNAGTSGTKLEELTEVGNATALGLWQVEKRLFADNDSARDVLEELRLELLAESPQEARQILRRRVELTA